MVPSPKSVPTVAAGTPANPLVSELKTRARLRLNALRRESAAHGDAPEEAPDAAEDGPRLRDCLTAVAREVGFQHWDHARAVLSGESAPGDDAGRLWHAPRANSIINQWFASLAEAREVHAKRPALYLLPYRRQFVLVQSDCITELGLDPRDPAWEACGRDLVAAYGKAPWLTLARQRLAAPPGSFEAVRTAASAHTPRTPRA